MGNIRQMREVWVREPRPVGRGVAGARWILSDTLERPEALTLMATFVEQGYHVRLTIEGGTYVTDKSW